MPIDNVPSVMTHGILSHERAARLQHSSVAMQPVQDRRDRRRVPQSLRLHQYANLYFNARNPMLYKRLGEANTLCVLRVSLDALRISGTVITDCNAASDYARFLDVWQWRLVEFDDVFSDSWMHPDDQRRYFQHKSRKCAEVLVPHRLPPELVLGARVINQAVVGRLGALAPGLTSIVDPVLFFQS